MAKFKVGDLISDGMVEAKVLNVTGTTYQLIVTADRSTSFLPAHPIDIPIQQIDAICTLILPAQVTTTAIVGGVVYQFTASMESHDFGKRGATETPKVEKTCLCDSLDLMRYGCQCGAIAKRKWGLGS
jgi:hypothetical protein